MLETPEEKRRFLSSEEMWNDVDYMGSMDTMWHHVMNHPDALDWLKKEREKDGEANRTRREEGRKRS
jgi:hypothetical protein